MNLTPRFKLHPLVRVLLLPLQLLLLVALYVPAFHAIPVDCGTWTTVGQGFTAILTALGVFVLTVRAIRNLTKS